MNRDYNEVFLVILNPVSADKNIEWELCSFYDDALKLAEQKAINYGGRWYVFRATRYFEKNPITALETEVVWGNAVAGTP